MSPRRKVTRTPRVAFPSARSKSATGPRRALLQKLANEARDVAIAAAKCALVALEADDDADVVDGHLLDLRWAMAERRGILNALHDLDEAGLL